MKKILSTVLALAFLLFAATPAFAAGSGDTVQPYYINTSQASITMVISDSGVASIDLNCMGLSNVSSIDAVVYLERYTEYGAWIRVNIRTGSNTWNITSNSRFMIETITFQLPQKGEYKATVFYTVHGSTQAERIGFYTTRTYS